MACVTSTLVAQIRRKSALTGVVLPTGLISRSCSTRSSFAWSGSGISPISSSRIEPRFDCSKRPL